MPGSTVGARKFKISVNNNKKKEKIEKNENFSRAVKGS
jgi:hypothetical protein